MTFRILNFVAMLVWLAASVHGLALLFVPEWRHRDHGMLSVLAGILYVGLCVWLAIRHWKRARR